MPPDHPLWVTFARRWCRSWHRQPRPLAAEVSRWSTPPRRVLDVAAGHGMFGIAGVWENWRDPASGEWVRTFASRHRPGSMSDTFLQLPSRVGSAALVRATMGLVLCLLVYSMVASHVSLP